MGCHMFFLYLYVAVFRYILIHSNANYEYMGSWNVICFLASPRGHIEVHVQLVS